MQKYSERQIEHNSPLVIILYRGKNKSWIHDVNDKVKKTDGSADFLIMREDQMISADDIEQMKQTLNSCERHGAVVSLNDHSKEICLSSKENYERIKEYLPNYRLIPWIDMLPVMIKAEMFERFGLLNEEFESIEMSLIEFSLRFNQYGWSTVRANVWTDAVTDSKECKEALNIDKKTLSVMFPYSSKIEDIYYVREQTALEHFAGIISKGTNSRTSILFSLYEVPPTYNGTAHFALKILEKFYDCYRDKYDIYILVKENSDKFFHLSKKYPKVIYPANIYNETFELAYVASQILSGEHMNIINKCCMKYCICMLDIICLRSHYLCKNDEGRYDLFRDSIACSDLMITISEFSRQDILSFFQKELVNCRVASRVIYPGTDKSSDQESLGTNILPFQQRDYLLVIGNPYKHKMIENTLEVLKETDYNYIVIGMKTEGYFRKSRRIYGYVSGLVDNDLLNTLFAGAKGIIFPSVYEGFGLTLYDAVVYQKKIIVCDTQVNLEIKNLLNDYKNWIITYRKLSDLEMILNREIQSFEKSVENSSAIEDGLRNWTDVAEELEAMLDVLHTAQPDIRHLEYRWNYLKRYQDNINVCDENKKEKKLEKRKAFFQRCSTRFPQVYKWYRKLMVMIDKEHYGNH